MSSLVPVAAALRRLLQTSAASLWLIVSLVLALTCPCGLRAENHDALKADASQYFRDRVTPFVKTYCLPCHRSERPTRAGVNFTPALKTPEHAAFTENWKKADARVRAHDMPPKEAKQPSDDDRRMFAEWLPRLKYLSDKDPGPFVIRRLTKPEYANTLHDLFGVPTSIADGLPDEVAGQGYLNSLSPLQLEQYLAVADNVLRQIVAPPGRRRTATEKRLFGQSARAGTQPGGEPRKAAREVARSLARKAYRRPPTEAELDTLVATFDLGTRNKLAYPQALGLMLKGILVSPQFLFITPAAEAESNAGIVQLDDYQLASRLSYFLWATMPDEELMTLAGRGKLHEPAVLQAQTKRLLDDPRSRALFDGFGAQWLNVGGLQRQVFDPALFPQMTPALRLGMYDEVRLFFQSIVRDNEPAIRFVNSDYTYLNGAVAAIYGLENTVRGPAMRKVRLSNSHRGGVLSMPGILAASSLPNRTSPVKRGVWVLEQVLGEQVPAPPPDVPALDKQDPAAVARLTLRQRTELHRTNPVCANCHKILDPIGFGLEKFDAIGRWRDRDTNGEAIDSSGELPGGEGSGSEGLKAKRFSGPAELKAIIAERNRDVARNLVEKMLGYALGRKLDGYDEIVVDDLMSDLAGDGYRMRAIITGVVSSYPFKYRRIEAPRRRNAQN